MSGALLKDIAELQGPGLKAATACVSRAARRALRLRKNLLTLDLLVRRPTLSPLWHHALLFVPGRIVIAHCASAAIAAAARLAERCSGGRRS